MRYRAEIDGLRAVAVIPVILFHAGFAAFGGGFVGVDVFFVISGYLITALLLGDLATGRFSIWAFYDRRARRLLPALFVVLAACLPVAWWWLLPGDLQELLQSVAAVAVFMSNILFWRQSGYFDTAAELKPLLHTWSLAVEEQFYLLFPPALWLAWRLGRRWMVGLIAVVFVVSLAAAQWGALHKPAAAFFLLPTRAWELALGALVACHVAGDGPRRTSPTAAAALGSIGLLLIVGAVFAYDRHTPFPGLSALVPTIGAILVILFATPDNRVGRLLGSKGLVGIGLISYSAYLWHQPLFAFARLKTVEEARAPTFAALSLVALGLAWLTWRFVERPFRQRGRFGRPLVFGLAAAGSASFLAIGMLGFVGDGMPQRFERTGVPVHALARITDVYAFYDYPKVLRLGTCHSVPVAERAARQACVDVRRRNLLLWGDSYAAALYSGLDAVRTLRHPDTGITQLTDGNAPPFPTRGRADTGDTVNELNDHKLAMVRQLQPDAVVLTWMIDGLNAIRVKEGALAALNTMIGRIHEASPRSEVIVVGPVPKWSGSLHRQILYYHDRHGRLPPPFMAQGLVQDDIAWDAYLRQHLRGERVRYVSAMDALCNDQGCLTRLSDEVTDTTAVDWGHLSKNGSVYLANRIEAQVFR